MKNQQCIDNSMIDEEYLKEKINNFSQYFCLCAAGAMVENIHRQLIDLGTDINTIVIEQF